MKKCTIRNYNGFVTVLTQALGSVMCGAVTV